MAAVPYRRSRGRCPRRHRLHGDRPHAVEQADGATVLLRATCILHDISTLVQGVSTHLGWQITSIVPSGPCGVKAKKCRPCDPEVGALVYRVDYIQKGSHYDNHWNHHPGVGHRHLYEVQQSPPSAGCICFRHDLEQAGLYPRPPAGAIPICPITGGGIE